MTDECDNANPVAEEPPASADGHEPRGGPEHRCRRRVDLRRHHPVADPHRQRQHRGDNLVELLQLFVKSLDGDEQRITLSGPGELEAALTSVSAVLDFMAGAWTP